MAKKSKAAVDVRDYQLLVEPVITEKSSVVGGAGRIITLRVHPRATKPEIKDAVERVFGVEVVGVNTCRFSGKRKRTTSHYGRTAGYKKAYVTLKEGQSVDIIEGL